MAPVIGDGALICGSMWVLACYIDVFTKNKALLSIFANILFRMVHNNVT